MEQEEIGKKGIRFFIIILIVIILFFSKKENQDRFLDFINTVGIKDKDLTLISSVPIEEGLEDIGFYDKSIMIWNGEKLIRLNIDGMKEWEKEFNLDELGISFGNRNIYIYEKPGGNIYYLKDMGQTSHRVELKTNIMIKASKL